MASRSLTCPYGRFLGLFLTVSLPGPALAELPPMPKAAPAVCIDWADALNHSEALAAWLRSQARVAIVAGDDAKAHELVEAADRLGLQGNLLVLFGPRCHGGAR